MRRGPAILLLFSLLFGAAYGAWRAAQEGAHRLFSFSPAHFTADRPTAGSTPLASRLVLIMIDGLRAEDTRLMPSLDWMHRQGASFRLTVPGPSYQPAVAATLLSGSPPSVHGLLRPNAGQALQFDHLLQAAERARLKTGGGGSPALGGLLGPTARVWHAGSSLEELRGATAPLLQANGPRLIVIQAEDLLPTIHQLQSADSDQPDYRNALAALDAQLVFLFDQIDWRSTAVIVTGSTPLDVSGHRTEGGEVPLLAAGSGVRPGSRGDGSLLDLAATASALLGIPTPMQALGRPILEMLMAEGRPADAILQSYLTSRETYTSTVLRSLGSDLTPAPAPSTAAEADGYLAGLSQQVREARFSQAKTGLVDRLPSVGVGMLVLMLYLIVVYRQPFGGTVLIAHLLFVGTFHLLFLLAGGRYGPGLAGLDGPTGRLLLRYGLVTGTALLLTAIAAGLILSRREIKRSTYLTTSALHLLLSLAAALSLPVGAAILLTGWEFPVDLPAIGLWIWFFLTALQVGVIGGLSPLWVGVLVRSVRIAQRLWPLKEVGNPEVNADKVVRLRAIRRSNKPV